LESMIAHSSCSPNLMKSILAFLKIAAYFAISSSSVPLSIYPIISLSISSASFKMQCRYSTLINRSLATLSLHTFLMPLKTSANSSLLFISRIGLAIRP
ncbi:hypothetical protein C0995_000552, partial [Termitomyces sp. Mi166